MVGRFSHIRVPNALNAKLMRQSRKRPFRRGVGGFDGGSIINGDLKEDAGWDYGESAGGSWEPGAWVVDNRGFTTTVLLAQPAPLEPRTAYDVGFTILESTNGVGRVRTSTNGGNSAWWEHGDPFEYVGTMTTTTTGVFQLQAQLDFVGKVTNIFARQYGLALPSNHVLTPAVISGGANAGYDSFNVNDPDGDLTWPIVNDIEIARLQSFGANFCKLDLFPVGDPNQWPGVASVTVDFSGAFVGSGQLNAIAGYSYGGNVANIQAGLNAAVGQAVNVTITAV